MAGKTLEIIIKCQRCNLKLFGNISPRGYLERGYLKSALKEIGLRFVDGLGLYMCDVCILSYNKLIEDQQKAIDNFLNRKTSEV